MVQQKLSCPEDIVLNRYVSGLLEEPGAAALEAHLVQCPHCEQSVHELARNKDSMLGALLPTIGLTAVEDSDLPGLIIKAQQLDRAPGNLPLQGRIAAPVPVPEFVSCLHKSGLINPSEVDLLVEESRAHNSEGLAQYLILRKKLTHFQANVLVQGRWDGLILGNYVILDKVGQGGMSTVFKARHRRLGRVVCLKVLHTAGLRSPEVVERFRREARTVAALDHPNIIVAHDADEADGIPFLVMEFVQGEDLAHIVATRGPFAPDAAVQALLQAARALAYAHDKGVIHRDVKPHNLLRDESGGIKILDMGLARFDSYLGQNPDATTHASMTATGVIMGTVDYMAPEQAINSKLADQRSDIYSLGCTLYFLITGKVLFEGDTLMEKLVAHREQPAPSLRARSVAKELDAIFQRMVAKQPSDRYESMTELARDLETLRRGQKPLAWQKVQARTRRRLQLAGVGIVLMLTAFVWFARPDWLSTSTPTPPPAAKSPPPIVGHPKTLLNGGPGRALVVVPHDWFYEDHFTNISKALKDSGVDMVTTSSQPGPARPKHNQIKPAPIDLQLDQFDVNDFDTVIFIGGNAYEFTQQNGKPGKLARQMIEKSLDEGRVVASIGSGDQALIDAGATNCKFQQDGACLIGQPKDRAGRVVTVKESKNAADLVRAILQAAKRLDQIKSGPAS